MFREYYLDTHEEKDYKSLAEKYGVSMKGVANYLGRTKRQLREILMDLLAETVDGPAALREEFGELFGKEGPREGRGNAKG